MQKFAVVFLVFSVFSLVTGIIQGFFKAFLEDRWKKNKKNEEALEVALDRAKGIIHTLERKNDLLQAEIKELQRKR